MSRLLFAVTPLALALALPLAAGQKDKEPEKPPPPPAYVLLRDDLLKEQQTLYELQTQWFLQVLKVKRRTEKMSNAAAHQQAVACGKMLDATRELPGLYDAAINRLKTDSLKNLAATKDVLKATGRLADEVQRAWTAVQKDAQEAFLGGREIGADELKLARAVIEAADKLSQAASALDGMLGADPSSAFRTATELVKASHTAYAGALKDARQQLQKLTSDSAPKAQQAFFQDRLITPLAALADDQGRLIAAGEPIESLQKDFPKCTPELVRKVQGQVRANATSLQEVADMLVIVCRLPDLAQRQRALHDRLRRYHEETVNKLLDGLDK